MNFTLKCKSLNIRFFNVLERVLRGHMYSVLLWGLTVLKPFIRVKQK